jgi:HlyD family secretion protein
VDRIGLKIAKNDVLGTDPAARTDVRVIEVKIRLYDSSKVSKLTNLQVKVTIDS